MSEKDFDKGYKSGFKFGKEVANEEWLDKVKQAREKIKNSSIEVYTDYEEYDMVETADVLKILDKLIESEDEK